jgi:hypothetical protein
VEERGPRYSSPATSQGRIRQVAISIVLRAAKM